MIAEPGTASTAVRNGPSPLRQEPDSRDLIDEMSEQAVQDPSVRDTGQARNRDAGSRTQARRQTRDSLAIRPFVPVPQARGRDRVRAEETTIQVTIGRIEVRAVTPPPAAAKPQGVPKVMTLDEYLRRKDGGRP